MSVSRRGNYGRTLTFLTVMLFAPVQVTKAWADVTIQIELSRQTMAVSVDDALFGTWPVSTALRGRRSPVGSYKSYALERMRYSNPYEQSPMPYATDVIALDGQRAKFVERRLLLASEIV